MTSRVIRHDTITLRSGVKEEGFEQFMREELVPHFSEAFKGPTRSSKADLKNQSLCKDTKTRGKFLWITAWDGEVESVCGSSFENARMSRTGFTDATETLLKKLESFGKHATETVFIELVSTEVAANT
jgi:hypothetical protein